MLYCRDCDWMQDGFWSWRSNPLRSLARIAAEYGRPRWIEFDVGYAGYSPVHSWRVLAREALRAVRRASRCRWRTCRSWRRAVRRLGRWPGCPECGGRIGQD